MNAAVAETRKAMRPMGMYFDMPFDDYHAVDAISATGLRLFARSPWHYRNRVATTPTRPMLRGSLAHCAQLEPDAMAARYIVVPKNAPKRPTPAQWAAVKSNESSMAAKEWWREFERAANGREVIGAEEFAICRAQLQAIAREPELAALFARGNGEVSIFWIDPDSRLYCKARIDWLQVTDKRARIGELKSTRDESPNGFGRTAASMKYELQRAHYVAAVKSQRLTLDSADPFTFAVVTSAAPVLAVPQDLPPEVIEQADDERSEILQRWAWCVKEDRWPTYGDGKQLTIYPAYALRSAEVEVSFAEEA